MNGSNRWKKTWAVVACSVILCLIMFAVALARPNRFLVGPYQGLGYGGGTELHQKLALWADTLKCNWAWHPIMTYERAETLMNWGFKLFDSDRSIDPGQRGDLAKETFLIWQTDSQSVPPWYDSNWEWRQGRKYVEPGGDTAWFVSDTIGDTAGWVLQGPTVYYNRSKLGAGVHIGRTATFRIKGKRIGANDSLATLYVRFYPGGSLPESTLIERTIYGHDLTGAYQTIVLPPWQQTASLDGFIRFPVRWYGHGDLYIDEVVDESQRGTAIVEGAWDSRIVDSIVPLLYGSGDSVVAAWFLNDESASSNNYVVIHRIDSVLRAAQGHAPASPVNSHNLMSYVGIAQPRYVFVSVYPFAGSYYGKATSFRSDYSSMDSVSLQYSLDCAATDLRGRRMIIDSLGDPGVRLIDIPQTYHWVLGGVQALRRPSAYEAKCLINLCLAYGTDGLIGLVPFSLTLC